MKKLFLLISLFVFAGATLLAQTKVITGTITSAVEGEGAIPGVTVQVKGTTIGTTTDVNGKYSLTVPQNANTLVFSYIGMTKQEVDIAGRSVINAVMQSEMLGLNEVIVSAFGIKRNANEIGASVTKVESELITQGKVFNAASALSGKVAGLQINTVNNSVSPDARVLLRGNRSFLGNNQALLVLDGVPVNLAYLATLNPNDIESMNVLKGGNSAALYGSEAANGVIIVTTKSGSRDRTTIQFSNTTTFDRVAFFPELQERFGSGSASDNYGNPLYEAFENQCYGPEFDGKKIQIGIPDENGDTLFTNYSAKPQEKYDFWNTGITVQNDLSFSSGNETGTIYVAIQDVLVKGIVPLDEARRDVIRVNASKTYKGFTASANVNYTVRKSNTTREDVQWDVLNSPMQIPLTDFSDWSANYGTDPITGKSITNWADINHYYNAYYYNPYETIERYRAESRNDYITGVLNLEQKITRWLTFSVRSAIAPNVNYYENRSYSRTFTPYGLSTYAAGRAVAKANILSSMSEGHGFGWRWTNDALVTFDNKFNDVSVRAIAGATSRESYSRQVDVSAASLEINDFFNLKNRIGEPGASESWSEQRTVGVFGDITVGYKNFAYLHVSGRNDWSSLLDKSNWSFFYPGIDASIILSEIVPGLKNDIVSFIKLRGGISKVGSINIGNYALDNTYAVASNFPFGTLSSYTVSDGLNNRGLQPEFTISKEAGVDVSFLKSRLNAAITVYQTNTTNQTVDMSISNATGYSSQKVNSGEMLNRGAEIELKTTPVQTANLRWDLNINYAYWYNRVVSLAGGLPELSLGANGVYAIVGQPYPTMKVQQFYRDPDGHVIVDAVTGMPSYDPLVVIRGQTTPKHLIGIQTNLRWKGFTLAGSADYRGGAIFSPLGLYDGLLFTGVGILSAANGRERFVFPNSVINTGTADAPVYVKNTNVTTQDGGVSWWTSTVRPLTYYSVVSGDVWKIRELSLMYEIPSTVFAFTNNTIKSASISFIGRNLFMFLPKNNIYTDPEFNNTTGNAVGRSDRGQTAPTRSYGFNLTVTF